MKPRAACGALACACALGAQAQPAPQVVPAARLATAPVVDGELAEWGSAGWTRINLAPAVKPEERANLGLDPRQRTTAVPMTVELKAGVAAGQIFLAARWPDDAPDTDYRPWERRGGEYVEGSQRDDAFAVRFALRGEFDRSMLSGKSYLVDLWLWSAGRSDRLGRAEDMVHRFATRFIEDAAEYEVKGVGTVYIKKSRDAGMPLYRNVRPARGASAERLPSVETNRRPSGSVADVAAKGQWKNGYWNLELARALDTGNGDDVALPPGSRIAFQIAVFNRSADEDKSVSEPLVLDLGAVR